MPRRSLPADGRGWIGLRERIESPINWARFTPVMDAAGWWEVEVPTPLGLLRFDVHIHHDGEVTASYRGRPIPVPAVQTAQDGDGLRVRWTQQLTFPVRVEVGLLAVVRGDRFTGIATAGSLMPAARVEGRRVA